MADLFSGNIAPFGCSYFTSYAGIHSIGAATGSLAASSGAAYPTANKAIFIPFRLLKPTRITKLWVLNGAIVSGNLDLGIYTSDGTCIASAGSTAQAGASVIQIITLGTAIRLPCGLFYMAIAVDNITATVFRTGVDAYLLKVLGMAQMASAFPLPVTVTFAAVASSYIPTIGFISEEG